MDWLESVNWLMSVCELAVKLLLNSFLLRISVDWLESVNWLGSVNWL